MLRVLAWPLVRLPSACLWRMAGLLSFLLAGNLLRRRRDIARTNLRLCFPAMADDARERLLRGNLQASVMGLFDSLRAWYAPASRLRGIADIEGLEHLALARAAGRSANGIGVDGHRGEIEVAAEEGGATGGGVILLCSHMCSITLATRLLNDALAAAGAEPAWIMKRPHNHPCIEAELDRRRRAYCGHTLDKRDAPALLAALSEGRTVSLAADQDFNFQNAFLPFFGVPASTLVAVPSLARRSGATVLPLWIRRGRDGRYLLRIEAPWPGYGEGDDVADTARYLRALEDWLRPDPSQYLWLHRRFKTRPAGEVAFY